MRRLAVAIVLASALVAPSAAGLSLDVSATNNATLGGLTLENGSVATYDDVAGTATLHFDEDLFTGNEDVDAFHLLDDGRVLLSTRAQATLGGLTFRAGDVVLYDAGSDSASIFFDRLLLTGNRNVDAVFLASDGTLVLSTRASSSLGGLSFEDGDLVRWDTVGLSASLLLSESLFTGDEDVDAVHVLPDGRIALSTTGNAELGGLSFGDGDVVAYDVGSDTASLLMSESLFSADEDVDALFVPEPDVALLWLVATAAFARRRPQAQPVS